MNHTYEKHGDECPNPGHCPICDGGLQACTVCRTYEGGLATHCPGVEQTEKQTDGVYAGEIDYVNGEWVKRKGN